MDAPVVFYFKYFRQIFIRKTLPPELARAQQLISAIDRGGIPLNPAKINAIARDLGLEVSKRAPMDETIARIRAYLKRA